MRKPIKRSLVFWPLTASATLMSFSAVANLRDGLATGPRLSWSVDRPDVGDADGPVDRATCHVELVPRVGGAPADIDPMPRLVAQRWDDAIRLHNQAWPDPWWLSLVDEPVTEPTQQSTQPSTQKPSVETAPVRLAEPVVASEAAPATPAGAAFEPEDLSPPGPVPPVRLVRKAIVPPAPPLPVLTGPTSDRPTRAAGFVVATLPAPEATEATQAAADPIEMVTPDRSRRVWPATPSLDRLVRDVRSAANRENAETLVRWADEVQRTLRELRDTDDFSGPQVDQLLDRLESLSGQGLRRGESQSDRAVQRSALRAAHGLTRRTAVWRSASQSVNDPDDVAGLLGRLEKIETNPIAADASEVASRIESFAQARDAGTPTLADAVRRHYRNANLRIAVADDLLRRLTPPVPPTHVPVRTVLAGRPVAGHSSTTAEVDFRLVPSPDRWRFEFLSRGVVHNRHAAGDGGVRILAQSQNPFRGVTPIVVDRDGLRRGPTRVDVDAGSMSAGVRNRYDAIPVIGPLVRSYALARYRDVAPQARRMTRQRIDREVTETTDQRLDDRIDRVTGELRRTLIGPIRSLDLDPGVIDMSTTDRRLVARYRVAGDGQLGAFTPRPRAPGDSVLSMQVHQSALNNTLARLLPGDERVRLDQLAARLAETFGRDSMGVEWPSDVTVRFAKTRPVTVEIDDDRMWLTLRIAELTRQDGGTLTRFIVRAPYRPVADGGGAAMVRDGHLRISGPGMSMRQRLPIRGVFNVVLSEDHRLPLVPPALTDRDGFAGLAVSQLVLRDGWIGLAIAPNEDAVIAPNEDAVIASADPRASRR